MVRVVQSFVREVLEYVKMACVLAIKVCFLDADLNSFNDKTQKVDGNSMLFTR